MRLMQQEDNMLFAGADMDITEMTAGGGIHDETARNLIATVDGRSMSPMERQKDDVIFRVRPAEEGKPQVRQPERVEDDDLAAMWPSQRKP